MVEWVEADEKMLLRSTHRVYLMPSLPWCSAVLSKQGKVPGLDFNASFPLAVKLLFLGRG
jgi:hypothetical protein